MSASKLNIGINEFEPVGQGIVDNLPITMDVDEEPPHPGSLLPLWDLRWGLREYFAEFFGTWLLLIFGNGVVAAQLFKGGAGEPVAAFLMITFGWGIGLAMALFCSLGVSGGHLNPAVTLGNAVWGGFPWAKVPGYILSQVLGAFTGAACIYGLYNDQIKAMPNGFDVSATGGIFFTSPTANNSLPSSAFSEFLLTLILLFVINGIFDRESAPATNYATIAVGLLVFSIGTSLGPLTGYAINPARDFGPRLFGLTLYGGSAFSNNDYYFWVPVIMPVLGSIVGIGLYRFFIISQKQTS